MTDAEIEALLREAEMRSSELSDAHFKQERLGHLYLSVMAGLFCQLATALRHSREELRAAMEDTERLSWLENHAREIQFSQKSRTSGGSSCGQAGTLDRPYRKEIDQFRATEWNDYDEMRALEKQRDAIAARSASEEKP